MPYILHEGQKIEAKERITEFFEPSHHNSCIAVDVRQIWALPLDQWFLGGNSFRPYFNATVALVQFDMDLVPVGDRSITGLPRTCSNMLHAVSLKLEKLRAC